jgi:hypothetical protein
MSTTTESIEKKFSAMGAKVRFIDPKTNSSQNFTINFRNGQFIINKSEDISLQIADLDKKGRHLLLVATIPNLVRPGLPNQTQRYLCGHDERDWFTCAVPKVAKTVDDAKEALKPQELIDVERKTVKKKNKQKRHRQAKGVGKIHRQGEFMFVPMPEWKPSKNMFVLKKEPMRANGRPHVAAEVIRIGGRTVYTLGARVLEDEQFQELQKNDPKDASRWRLEKANPTVYAKGTIRHPDHKTLDLGEVWHKVLVSTEKDARFARNVLFID